MQPAAVPSPPIWTSLEVTKLIVSGATPVVVVLVGLWISRQLKKLEYLQWTNQKVVEKRLEIYSELVPLLNDLLCYFTYIGCWKELTPPAVVKLKRTADRIVYINAALFSDNFQKMFHEYIDLCFLTYNGMGQDAKLKTLRECRQQAHGNWDDSWSSCFAERDKCTDPRHIREAYMNLVSNFAKELGLGLTGSDFPTGYPSRPSR